MKEISIKRNAILNVLKQICNIIFPLITYPYVSRILTSTNLGKYSFSDSVVGIVMVFATLGIQTYAVREGARIRDDRQKIIQFTKEIYSINILSMIISLLGLVLCVFLFRRLQRDLIITCLLCINIVTTVIGRDWINSIYEDFFYVTVRYIAFQVIALVLLFAFVHKPEDYIIYTIITVIGNSGGYVLNFFYTQRYVPVRVTLHLNLKKHLKPMLYLFGVALAIKIYIQSDITVLGFFRPDDEVGVYTIASKVYTIIKALLNAIIMVVIPRLSVCLGSGDNKTYNKLLNNLKAVLYTIVFPCVVGLFFESRNVMLLIGGNEYASGSSALQILCVALAFAVFGCFYAQGILVPNREDRTFFIATIISAVVNIVLNIVVIPYLGMNGAALTTVLAEFIVFSLCAFRSRNHYEKEREIKQIISIIVGCSGIAITCILVNILNVNFMMELLLAIILSSIVYVFIGVMFKNPVIMDGIKAVRKRIRK